jgi:hypothetical protein
VAVIVNVKVIPAEKSKDHGLGFRSLAGNFEIIAE